MDDLTRLGIEHFNAGRFEEALRRFREAVAADESVPEARVFIGHVSGSLGRPAEAVAEFASVISDFPRHLPAYAGLANVLLRQSPARDAAAEKALLRVLTLKPGDGAFRARLAETLRACGQALRSVGELETAEKALSKALLLGRDAAARRLLIDVLRERAQTSLAEGDMRKAEGALRKILGLEPENETARRGLVGLLRRRGLAHVSSGRLDAAEKSLRRALALAPRDKTARRQKSEVRSMREKSEKARLKAARLRNAEKARLLRRRVGAAVAAGRLERAEAALRKALRAGPGAGGAARQLAEVLRMRERAALARLKAARRAKALAHEVPNAPSRLPEALRAWRAVAELDPRDGSAHLSISLLLRWIGTPEQEQAALRRAVEKGRELNRADRFKALMRLGRCASAVRLAEEMLDDGASLPDLRAFWDPWEKDNRPDREAALTDPRALDGAPAPWRQFYLGCLGGPRGLRHFDAIPGGERYRWMHYSAAMEALFSGDFAMAVRSFNAALRRATLDWRAHGYLAEAYACVDVPALARREMARGFAAAPKNERAQALAWRGELDLWLGDYARALAHTTRACEMGAPFAYGWKGAALLKLGRRKEALAQLDLALKLFPGDEEARLWRAEAKRELGRSREALEDLASVTRQHRVWILFNSALAKLALGDAPGMKADFDALPAEVVAHVRRALGPGNAAPRNILEAGLKLARGFRRGEYGQAVWLSRRAERA